MAVTGAAAATSAQELAQSEKEHALLSSRPRKMCWTLTKGLSEAQWNFKPAPDRWSVAQVMEHISGADDFIPVNLLKEKVTILPAGAPGRDVKKIDAAVEAMIPDRSHKAQAPEPLVPNNRFGSSEGMDGLVGKMDGYEFILLIAAHSERHVKQIDEVKADPNFPKS